MDRLRAARPAGQVPARASGRADADASRGRPQRRSWLGQQRLRAAPAAQARFDDYLMTRRPGRPADRHARAGDLAEQAARRGRTRRVGRAAALPARHRHAQRRRADGRDRRLRALRAAPRQFMSFVGLVPIRALLRRTSERRARSPRRVTATSAACSSRRRGISAAARAPATTIQRRRRDQHAARRRARHGTPSSACTNAGSRLRQPRQGRALDRRRDRPRTRRVRLGDRRPTSHSEPIWPLTELSAERRADHRRSTLASFDATSAPATRVVRQRQLPTVPGHAVPKPRMSV